MSMTNRTRIESPLSRCNLADDGAKCEEGPPKCPECGAPAVVYIVLWDEHQCPNEHRWDGPANGGPAVHDDERCG